MKKEKLNKKKKLLLIGLGMAATGLLSYFGWEYYKKRRNKSEDDANDSSFDTAATIPPQKSTFTDFLTPKQIANDDFPLKKGSKGAKVKVLQDALIAKNGKAILPKYGADGSFGTEMTAALKKLNLPDAIDESTYNVIVQSASSFFDASAIAKSLYKDAVNKNISGVIGALKSMRNKGDYSAVSNEFKKYLLRGVSQTLVNGLLGSFSDENQKQQIRLEFSRMGLKYDGVKWSLSGLDGFKVITTQPTIIWRTPSEGAKVPAKMILGTEVAQRGEFTLFENNGKNFIVKTTTIQYL